MNSVVIELRSAEGGLDSKDLIQIQYGIYLKWATRNNLEVIPLDSRPGLISFQVTGKDAWSFFKHEAGGLRFQRIPPTERKGRVHTSTITVAVLAVPDEGTVQLNDRDLDVQTTRGSGAGGQHRNRTDSAVILTHKPSGLVVRAENERSQHRNLLTAKAILYAKLQEAQQEALQGARNDVRRSQLGKGQRGDKRRSIALQRGQVVDHVLGIRMSAEKYLKGDLSELY